MRKLLVLIVAILTMTTMVDARKHVSVTTTNTPTTQVTVSSADLDSDSVDVDTVAVDTTSTVAVNDMDDFNNLKDFLGLSSTAITVISISGMVLAFLFLLMPFIIIAVVCYLIFRRRDSRPMQPLRQSNVNNIQPEKPQPTGQTQPLQSEPQAQTPRSQSEYDAQWTSGVKNICVGIGLTIFFYCFFNSIGFASIGVIVTCVGIGKVIIANHYRNGKD